MHRMVELAPRQSKLLLRHVRAFAAKFHEEVVEILAHHFSGAQPTEVHDLLEQLTILERQLEVKQDPVKVHRIHSRLLRRILIEERRAAAEAIDEPLRRAMDRQLVRQLRGQLAPLESLMEAEWFTSTEALPLPRLTDYMSVRHAEEALSSQLTLAPREYDEKFHILEAPSLFYSDLQFYRRKCALRDAQLVVAYADIDDFKTLNTRYTETRVDLDVLGPFMGAIEAHMFAHGHAYRFGGDEYVLLLPNAPREAAADFLASLQRRLSRTSYRGVSERPTLSIGYAVVDRDTVLTDREVLAAANRAKNYVKERQKGAIASFEGPMFRDDDLRLVHQPISRRDDLRTPSRRGGSQSDFPAAVPPVTSSSPADSAAQRPEKATPAPPDPNLGEARTTRAAKRPTLTVVAAPPPADDAEAPANDQGKPAPQQLTEQQPTLVPPTAASAPNAKSYGQTTRSPGSATPDPPATSRTDHESDD